MRHPGRGILNRQLRAERVHTFRDQGGGARGEREGWESKAHLTKRSVLQLQPLCLNDLRWNRRPLTPPRILLLSPLDWIFALMACRRHGPPLPLLLHQTAVEFLRGFQSAQLSQLQASVLPGPCARLLPRGLARLREWSHRRPPPRARRCTHRSCRARHPLCCLQSAPPRDPHQGLALPPSSRNATAAADGDDETCLLHWMALCQACL